MDCRRFVLPSLFVVHMALVLGLCVLGRAQDGATVTLHALDALVLNQAILIAIWVGLGPEPIIARIFSGVLLLIIQCVLAAIPSLGPIVLQLVRGRSDLTVAFALFPMGLAASGFMAAFALFLVVRRFGWRFTFASNPPPRYSAGGVLFVLIAIIASLFGLFRDRFAWRELGELMPPDFQLQPVLTVMWQGALLGAIHWLVIIVVLWLALSRFTAQWLYARSWSWLLVVLAIVAIACATAHRQLDALDKAPVALSTLDSLALFVGRCFLTYSPTLVSLLIIGAAGWRLWPASDDDAPAESPSRSYPLGIHIAALAAVIVSAAALIWTETLDTAYVRMTASDIESDSQERFTQLSFRNANDLMIARIPKSAPLESLELSYGRVSAEALSRLRKWPSVEAFALDNVEFEPRAGVALAHLPTLSRLTLAGKTIKDEHLREMPTLEQVESLVLHDSGITAAGIAELHKFPSLKVLHLGDTDTNDAGLQQLPKLPQLDALFLSGTEITDSGVQELKRFPSLRWLVLSSTRIGDEALKSIARLPNLERLSILHTRVTPQGLAHLKGMQLEQLDVAHGWGDVGLKHFFAAVEPQEVVDLYFWRETTDAGLAHLDDCTVTLVLSSTNFTDAGMPHLARLQNLKRLYLYGTRITDQGLRELASLTQLRELNLSQTSISDDGLQYISSFTNLQTLSLGDTKITGTGLGGIVALEQLEHLNLSGTTIEDEALIHVAKLPGLTALWLTNTRIGDDGLAHLATAPQLGYLQLAGTKIGDDGLRHLAKIPHLAGLDVSNTKIG
ncbi:MAG: hypothetical protein QGG36_10650, partial [Pirellulaceae bacterium]|nr:hypothetical protein [Pirellulaceae bacterium]